MATVITNINRLKKIYDLLQKVNTLENKDHLLECIYQYIKTQIKGTNKKPLHVNKECNSLEQTYEKILIDINKIGKPFVKLKLNKNSKTYKRTLRYVKKHYKKHRYEIVDIFRLGHKYFCNANFTYKPEKITPSDFFRYRKVTIQYSPGLEKYTNSWFKEFAKGEKHINDKFIRKIKDRYPELTKEFIRIWQSVKKDELTVFDLNSIIMFVSKSHDFADTNKISTRTIFDVVNIYLQNEQKSGFIDSTKFLVSDYLWKKELKKLLIDANIFKSRRDIK